LISLTFFINDLNASGDIILLLNEGLSQNYAIIPVQSWYIPNAAKATPDIASEILVTREPNRFAAAKRIIIPDVHIINVP
jgi:hypothetical protein